LGRRCGAGGNRLCGDRDDAGDALHDFFVLLDFLEIVGGLEADPDLGGAAEQAGQLAAHDGGEGLAAGENAVEHLPGDAKSFGGGGGGESGGGEHVVLEDLAGSW
jgi:hypothetical protein